MRVAWVSGDAKKGEEEARKTEASLKEEARQAAEAELSTELELSKPEGGAGMRPQFTSESGRQAVERRWALQRELKRRAREIYVEKNLEVVSDAADLQADLIKQAKRPNPDLEKIELDQQKLGLNAAEKMLDRLLDKPTTVQRNIEDSGKEAELENLDDEWIIEAEVVEGEESQAEGS